VPSVLLNVVAERSKIGRFVSPGKFSKEITSRKGALERVREYSGFLLIERLIISRLDAPPPNRLPKGGNEERSATESARRPPGRAGEMAVKSGLSSRGSLRGTNEAQVSGGHRTAGKKKAQSVL
jgi:hypothetical protein